MFEIAAVMGLAFLTGLFAYLTFKVDSSRIHLQILFLLVSLFFATSTMYAIADFSLQAQTKILVNTTTNYTYANYTDAGGGNHTLVASTVETPIYANLTDYSHQYRWYITHYGVLSLLTVFVLFYFVMLVIISVFTRLWGKNMGGGDDDGDL